MSAADQENLPRPSDGMPMCYRCRNVRWVTKGQGAARCRCLKRSIARKALSVIPRAQFGRPKLSRLKPDPSRHPKQPQVSALLKSAPDDSYVICGDNGVSKTHMGWALYRRAVERRRAAKACLLAELLEEFKEWELKSHEERLLAQRDGVGGRPMILPDDLKTDKRRYTLFLDEFEKARATEFSCEQLFKLLNAARDFDHQLIITSNKEWDELRARWSRIDEVYGNSIMKRLEGCKLIEMF